MLRSRRPVSVIAGQNGETRVTTPIPARQNGTKCPRLLRSSVIAGQNWRYSPQMTRNEGSSRTMAGAKRTKHRKREGAPGPPTRMTHNPNPAWAVAYRSGYEWANLFQWR
jgi:hypothetical protein